MNEATPRIYDGDKASAAARAGVITRRGWTAEEKAIAKRMLRRGSSFREVGDALGRSKACVAQHFYRRAIPIRRDVCPMCRRRLTQQEDTKDE